MLSLVNILLLNYSSSLKVSLPGVWFFCCSSGMINLKELSLISGKAAWMAYLVILFSFGLLSDFFPLSCIHSMF